MSRRLEGPRLDTARADGRDVRQAESVRGQSIGRRRMNDAERARQAASAGAAEDPQVPEFQPARNAADLSLDEVLLDFVMPVGAEPGILRRCVPILQRFVVDLVPDLEGGEQLRTLAVTLMEEEIERHRNLVGRMQEGSGI
jgi:hypothetical protein